MVPSDIGRIPYKVRSGFSSFTADQWKNWTIHFSLLVLHDILSGENLECWRHFCVSLPHTFAVNSLLLTRFDWQMLFFCSFVEEQSACMEHTSLHPICTCTATCVLVSRTMAHCMGSGYLPLNATKVYWVKHHVTTYLLRHNLCSISWERMKFCQHLYHRSFSGELKPLFPKQIQASGSLHETISPAKDHDMFLPMTSRSWTIDSPNTKFKLPSHCTRKVLLQNQVQSLVKLYSHLHSVSRSVITASSIYMQ